MAVWMMSHLFQLARVVALCAGVEVPNTNPCIFSAPGASVIKLTIITTMMQNRNIHPQKNNQFKS